jgi:hypothetical protein
VGNVVSAWFYYTINNQFWSKNPFAIESEDNQGHAVNVRYHDQDCPLICRKKRVAAEEQIKTSYLHTRQELIPGEPPIRVDLALVPIVDHVDMGAVLRIDEFVQEAKHPLLIGTVHLPRNVVGVPQEDFLVYGRFTLASDLDSQIDKAKEYPGDLHCKDWTTPDSDSAGGNGVE